jgi:hypothetical protein
MKENKPLEYFMRKSSRRKKNSNSSNQNSELESFEQESTPVQNETPRKIYPTTTISINWDSLNSRRRVSNDIRDEITDLYYSIQKGASKATVQRLNELIEECPDLQILQSYLEIAYRIDDEVEKANEIALQSMKRFPDTIFSKISQIEIYISKNEIDKIPEFLNHKFDFRLLFPEKATFHIQEIISFHYTLGKYFAMKTEPEKAQISLEGIKSIDDDHIFIKLLNKVIDKHSGLKFYQKVLKKLK